MDNAVFAAAGLEQNVGWGLAWMNVTQKKNTLAHIYILYAINIIYMNK